MTPLLLGAAGVLALVLGGIVLRTFGPRYRVGRLLATTPRVSIAEALQLAASGRRRYVRIDGRVDAEDEFEDADHRPLVFRRTRLESLAGREWRVFEDQRQAVPFAIREGLDSIAIDHAALDAGLVVVPRESLGRAADLPDRVPAGLAGDTPVRAWIDQVSSVEHAIVLGVPMLVPGDPPMDDDAPAGQMSAGLGRPLVLSVLEPSEAMRVLAGDRTGRTRLAALCLAAGAALIVAALAWAVLAAIVPGLAAFVPGIGGLIPAALAASPEPSVAAGGDPRSNGQGPGLVGTPGLAILVVLAVALVAVIVTTIYVRLTKPADGGAPHR
ncbi:MAG TPA: hypothetical protein VFY18_00840 [Candidatus Limnocylindrales bacterium]|nr:hypothetical protein [Candidatus Limnocylindrales bacterium]